MDLLHKFQNHWQKQFCHLSSNNLQLLLAVSGGVDSVVLVDLVQRSGFNFHMAHCNFQLRGSESERDENFVRSLGTKYEQEISVKRFDTKQYAADNKISIQEAARDLRYAWFKEIVDRWEMADDSRKEEKETGTIIRHLSSNNSPHNFIATAHHADDNIETLLMHFFRGTGIQGLMGIQPELKERRLIRPLLCFRKSELLEYAAANKLEFVEDSSNASDKYTRNFFRNQLLPQIKEVFPKVEENLLHNIERLQEVSALYRQSVEQHVKKLVEQKGNEIHIPVIKWKRTNPLHTITWELIKPYHFHAAQTEEVIKLLDAENGSYQSSATHRIIKNRNWMIISPVATETAQHIVIGPDDKEVLFENGMLAVSHEPAAISFALTEAFLDANEIGFPLLLRKYKTGDYFYPLGMQKKKKVSKFLIDLKLSRTDKEKVWVIESDKKILWVVGYRIDNRFKVNDQTKNILHITFRK